MSNELIWRGRGTQWWMGPACSLKGNSVMDGTSMLISDSFLTCIFSVQYATDMEGANALVLLTHVCFDTWYCYVGYIWFLYPRTQGPWKVSEHLSYSSNLHSRCSRHSCHDEAFWMETNGSHHPTREPLHSGMFWCTNTHTHTKLTHTHSCEHKYTNSYP